MWTFILLACLQGGARCSLKAVYGDVAAEPRDCYFPTVWYTGWGQRS